MVQLDDIDDTQLRMDINQLVKEDENAARVIERLVNFFQAKLESSSNLNDGGDNKRRKLIQQQPSIDTDDNDDPLQQSTKIPDLSFQLPARKKYTLVVTRSKLQLLNEKTQTVEHAMAARDIVMVACVPTPEKPSGSFTFALFSQQTSLEPFVFTLPDKGSLAIRTITPGTNQTQDERTLTQPEEKKTALTDLLLTTYNVITPDQLAMPSRKYYASSGVSPSTGKADTDRTFVKTYLRTKDGVLYFLPQGILFGFKKPTVFVPKAWMTATVITNVTKHTFDLGLQLLPTRYPLGAGSTSWAPFLQQNEQNKTDDDADTTATTDATGTILLPFSMIEQADYAGIEGYIKKAGINDQSMTDATKAPEPTKTSSKNQYENEASDDDDETTAANESNNHELDDDQDGDVDFVPGDNSDEDNPLEYDTDASLDDDDDDDNGRSSHSKSMELDSSNDDDDGVDLLDDDDD